MEQIKFLTFIYLFICPVIDINSGKNDRKKTYSIIHHRSTFQKLGGKIEEVTCKDLIDLSQDLYYLILQKLKEKALDLEEKIDKWRTEDISLAERNNMNALEKDLIKVGI